MSSQTERAKKANSEMSGSESTDVARKLFSQVTFAATSKPMMETDKTNYSAAIAKVMKSIGPRDELEGMIAAQLIAAHDASMDCYSKARRTKDDKVREQNLKHAHKLSAQFLALRNGLQKKREYDRYY